MTYMHYIGAVLVFILITLVGIYSGRHVKSSEDFTNGGRKAGAGVIVGSLVGTLAGGASTIGTAQLAFTYGFSAWWFTLGGGIGFFFLACVYAKPLYNSRISTLPQVFTREYGPASGTVATLLTSMGSFLSMVSQMLSGIALITAINQLVSPIAVSAIMIVLMLAYVMFGGVWGTGNVGIAKIILLYTGIGICGILAVCLQGGISSFRALLPSQQYFNLIARGASVDIGAGISLILGILSTQTYFQAMTAARSLKISRIGILISAALLPLIGIGGIFVGMYMKLNYPDIVPASALPIFLMEKLPPLLSGMIIAALLVTLVGSGAGLALGLSSMLCNDIYHVYINKTADDKKMLRINRLVILIILFCTALFSLGNMGTLILGWSFMSMGLRGAVAFAPLCTALFLPGRIPRSFAITAMIAGPVCVLIGKFILPPSIDSLFLGLGASVGILIVGFFVRKIKAFPSDKGISAAELPGNSNDSR